MAEATDFASTPGMVDFRDAKSPRKMLLAVFLGALMLRWAYVVVMYLVMGDAGLMGIDSSTYVPSGREFGESIAVGSVSGWQWLGPNPFMFPLFSFLLAANFLVAGKFAILSYALCQGVIDAGSCLIIAGIARAIDPRYAIPAALAACVNPTQIVVAGQVYPDTGFMFCVALTLWAAIHWLRQPSWRATLLVGTGLGAAAMFRVLVTAFVPALLVYLLVVSVIRNGARGRAIVQIAAAGAIFGLCAGIISLRNETQYGSWALTPQTGTHLADWVVPLIRQAQDGTPWAVGHDEMERLTRARFGPPAANPFEDSRFYSQVAYEQLGKFSAAALAKAWLYGAVINLGAPAIILSPPIMQLPRTGFYDTPGATMPEKMVNFLFHSDNKLYTWVLLIGTIGVAVVRLIQLCGLAAILRQTPDVAPLLLLAGWCLTVLLINGPVAQPKYRLPMEPVLCVLSGAGLHLMGSLRRRKGNVGSGST